MRITSNRRGATLPLAILAIVLISLTVAAGYARVSSERRINEDQQAQVDAFAVAQSGLERYINGIVTIPPESHDTTITGIPGGSAQVSLRRLHVGVGLNPTLYVISSRGTSTGSVRYGASTPSAERTVAQYGVWQPGNIGVSAAWTSISGLQKSGGSGTLTGVDQCGVAQADHGPQAGQPVSDRRLVDELGRRPGHDVLIDDERRVSLVVDAGYPHHRRRLQRNAVRLRDEAVPARRTSVAKECEHDHVVAGFIEGTPDIVGLVLVVTGRQAVSTGDQLAFLEAPFGGGVLRVLHFLE